MNTFYQRYRTPIAATLLILLAGGYFFYGRLQTSLFPEINFPKIKIIADAGEQPVDKMLVTVTRALESAIKLAPDVSGVRSVTSRGSCEISAFLNSKANIDLVRQNIESRIAQVRGELPAGTVIRIEKMNPSILPVMGYTLESKQTLLDLKQIALYTVRPFLSQVSGVSEVRIAGGKNKEYWILLNPVKMNAFGITVDRVTSALSQTNFITSNGFQSSYRRLYLSVTSTALGSLDDIRNVVVSGETKRPIFVSDVATVSIKEGIEYVKINSHGRDAVLVSVLKQPSANLLEVSEAVEKRITELRQLLPAGLTLTPYYKQADFVSTSVKSVQESLLIGLALAIFVAVIFLRSFRASLAILICIPVTLALSIIALYAAGYSLNIMTLGALAASVGLIIDDAIVVVEQIHRTEEEHPNVSASERTGKALIYLLPAMIFSSLSTLVIFLPFGLMTGVAGAYFNVLTGAMIITLACSFFVSWIGLPVLYLLVPGARPVMAVPHEVHKQSWVYTFIRRPWISAAFICFLIVSLVYCYPRLETGFLPELDEGTIVCDYSSPPGTSLEETDRMLRSVEELFPKVSEVEAYSRRTGTQMGFFITEPNRGDYLIQLKTSRKRATTEVIDDLRRKISHQQPALRIDFGQVIGDMLGDLMTSVQPIEIKVFGQDRNTLNTLASTLTGILAETKGVADAFNGIVIAGPSLIIRPDEKALARHHITLNAFQQEMQAHLSGIASSGILEKEQLSPLRVLFADISGSPQNLQIASISTSDGRRIPLGELASVKLITGVSEVQRENLQSVAIVTARLNGRDLGSTMNEISKRVSSLVTLPKGYHLEYGGDYAQQQQSFSELLLILLTSSLLVFLIILFFTKKLLLSVAMVLISMLGVCGSILALYLTHTPLNVGSYTGIVMIVGIIGENAIFTWWQYSHTRLTQSLEESVVFAVSTRLRPKLMTALGAIVALLPVAAGFGTGAKMHQPLAIAVIGGFLAGLPLLLIVFPSALKSLNGR